MTLHKNIGFAQSPMVRITRGKCEGIAWDKAQKSEHANEQSTKPTSANSAALHPDRA